MRYRVSGVWLSTQREGVLFLAASSADQAREEAFHRGMDVRTVTAVGAGPDEKERVEPTPDKPSEEPPQ